MHFTVGKISSTRGRIACRKTPSRTKLLATGACFHRYRSGTGMNAKRSMYASTIQPSFVSPMWATSCRNTPMHKSWPTGITIVFHKHIDGLLSAVLTTNHLGHHVLSILLLWKGSRSRVILSRLQSPAAAGNSTTFM